MHENNKQITYLIPKSILPVLPRVMLNELMMGENTVYTLFFNIYLTCPDKDSVANALSFNTESLERLMDGDVTDPFELAHYNEIMDTLMITYMYFHANISRVLLNIRLTNLSRIPSFNYSSDLIEVISLVDGSSSNAPDDCYILYLMWFDGNGFINRDLKNVAMFDTLTEEIGFVLNENKIINLFH